MLTKFRDLKINDTFVLPGQHNASMVYTKVSPTHATKTGSDLIRFTPTTGVVPENASVADIFNSWSQLN